MRRTLLTNGYPKKRHDAATFVGMQADLRHSTGTKKYRRDDRKRYPKLEGDFEKVAERTIKNCGTAVWGDYEVVGGDTLAVAFYTPWAELTAICALSFSIRFHKAISGAGFNAHGVGMALSVGTSKADVLKTTARICPWGAKRFEGTVDSFLLVPDEFHKILPPEAQNWFNGVGVVQIGKKHDKRSLTLHKFCFDTVDSLAVASELDNLLKPGPVGVLSKGLCPHMDLNNPGEINFLKSLIRHSSHRVHILQTYIPHVSDLRTCLSGCVKKKKAVDLRLLLLNPEWKVSKEDKILEDYLKAMLGGRLPHALRKLTSPLAFQRGRDFGYPIPAKFGAEVETCIAKLRRMMDQGKSTNTDFLRVYDATPSACIHIFDDLLFLGNFLQGTCALASPHLVFVKGCDVFRRFEAEFHTLWKASKTYDNLNPTTR
ncbi:MAG: hypothetical protein DRI48_10225 [Chloroflexi bacterium]|nr:MAG: hypothetical protein DRI48_10225 [Chloroflexota bacterium]